MMWKEGEAVTGEEDWGRGGEKRVNRHEVMAGRAASLLRGKGEK